MARLSWNEMQDRAAEFASKWQNETYEKGESQSFWSDFLNIYGVDRKRFGAFFEYAVKKSSGKQGFIDLFWPGKLLAEQKSGGKDLSKASVQAYEYLENLPDHDLPEAIVLSDFASFVVIDPKTNAKTEFALADLPMHIREFAFLVGETKRTLPEEDPVNRKAAEAMAGLHNTLRDTGYGGHDLEVLLVRLVFCLFADDSEIFEHRTFEAYMYNRTEVDGSDFGPKLIKLFQVLNTDVPQRSPNLDTDLAAFPYIDGGLFCENIDIPDFNHAMRDALLKAMELDWSKVSPAIFGSMFQGVMDSKQRRNLGAHYTSEKNILKVIKPLFLDDLYEEFAKVKYQKKKLTVFHEKLASLTFLDPACGCGNFLVITYRELRLLEHKVLDALYGKNTGLFDVGEHGVVKCDVDQMYGIEIEEFPSLIAETALWLTDHQMNREYTKQTGITFRRIPLKKRANIHHANALTIDWAKVIDPSRLNYILGNPPFLGKAYQSTEQKSDFAQIWKGVKGAGVLDFVTAWHKKAIDYIQHTSIRIALVSTNSISQGEQVGILWKYLYSKGAKIDFAHRTFKWSNDASGKAAVHCVIIGFSVGGAIQKLLFDYTDINGEPIETLAKNINPYLIDAPGLVVEKRTRPLNEVPPMNYGSMPNDGGHLLLDVQEMHELIANESEAERWIRPFVMGNEFINNIQRYCLWLVNIPPDELRSLPKIRERVEQVRTMRTQSTRPTTRALASMPTLFGELRQPKTNYLALPRVSSENRQYIPMGFLSKDIIAGDKVYTIDNASMYHFAVLNSRMHMAWMRVTAGRLKSDYSYSNTLVYNNFIWPEAADEQKAEIENLAQAVLDARANYPDASLADLYDPLTMPPDLTKAHKTLDRAVDRLYRTEPFADDRARVTHLFELYQVYTTKA